MPYLHFDTYTNMIRRRYLVKRRLDHGRAGPVPKEISDLESLELKVIWEYIGADPPLNCRRTLDQFGYPSLQETYARDDDQMLYKLTKKQSSESTKKPAPKRAETFASKLSSMVSKDDETSSESDFSSGGEHEDKVKEGNVLMVDQLWLWAIDTSEHIPRILPRLCRSLRQNSKSRNLLSQARVLA